MFDRAEDKGKGQKAEWWNTSLKANKSKFTSRIVQTKMMTMMSQQVRSMNQFYHLIRVPASVLNNEVSSNYAHWRNAFPSLGDGSFIRPDFGFCEAKQKGLVNKRILTFDQLIPFVAIGDNFLFCGFQLLDEWGWFCFTFSMILDRAQQ